MLEHPKAFHPNYGKVERMMTMGNKQERLFQMGWLSAMIEGEGNISLTWSKNKNKKYVQLAPRVQITNSDKLVIEKVQEILKFLNVGCYIQEYREIYKVMICGMKRCNRLLWFIKDHMLGKKERAQLLYEYTEHRINNKQSYNEYDKNVFLKMRELNGKPITDVNKLKLLFEIKSSTTTRQTPNKG